MVDFDNNDECSAAPLTRAIKSRATVESQPNCMIGAFEVLFKNCGGFWVDPGGKARVNGGKEIPAKTAVSY